MQIIHLKQLILNIHNYKNIQIVIIHIVRRKIVLKNKPAVILTILVLFLIVLPISFACDNSTDIIKENTDCNQIEVESTDNMNAVTNQDENIETIYVSPQGSDKNNGTASQPVKTIAKSIELASNYSSPKIIINEGIYEEYGLNINHPVDIQANGSVIIDACKKDYIFDIDTLGEVKLTGITFQNAWGGAISILNAKVTIDKSIFVNNTSDKAGAIYWNANDGTLTNSYFTKNRARTGSAIVWGGNEESELENFGENGLIVNITLEDNDNANTAAGCMGLAIFSDNVGILNSTFINNHGKTSSTGGALYAYGENILIDNCLFENNTMSQAPAIQANGNNVTIKNCLFNNNSIANNTGMDTSRAGAVEIQSINAQIINNTFTNNGGDECYNGGAIAVIYSDLLRFGTINITDNRFINNSATYGGCIFVNGGYESYCEFEGIINNNLFESATALTAAGVYLYMIDPQNSNLTLKNNIFKNLTAYCVSAFEIDYALADISNNTIMNCTSRDGNNHIYNNEGYIAGNLTVTVNNNDTITLLAGHYLDVNATVADDMGNAISGGTIRFIVAGSDVDEDGFSLETGTATVRFYSTVVGIYPISADYTNGDLANVKTSIVIALPYEIIIKFENRTALCEETILIPVNVGVNGEILEEGKLTIVFDENEYTANVINGTAIVNLTMPEENGTYNLTVTYDIKSETNTILVKDNHVIISSKDVKVTPNTGKLNVKLTDSEGNPLSNETLNVIIANTENNLITDENGSVSVGLNLSKGNYTAAISYIGNKYKSANATASITVDYIDVILTADNISVNYGEAATYVVRLTDNSNNPIANAQLSLSVANKITNVTTDSNGIAALAITLLPNTYTITASYGGNNIYYGSNTTNTIVINSLAKLKGSDITMYYSDNKYYKVRLYGDDGKVLAGKNVKITVNKKTYTRKTDSNGYASLKVSLTPATYTVTAKYNNLKTSNKIVVKKVLSAKNISKKKAKTIKFTAKLSKGKTVLKNKNVKFKIKGKTYAAKTNKKGIATVSLKNLKVGKYTIYTYYGSSKIKNTIQIRK